MDARDRPHGVRRGIVIEQDTAAAVDLNVQEAWRKQGAVRQALMRPGIRNVSPRGQPVNAAALDQHRGMAVPTAAVENPLGKDGVAAVLGSAVVKRHPICVKVGTGLSLRQRQI
jgi:hypothetical protein